MRPLVAHWMRPLVAHLEALVTRFTTMERSRQAQLLAEAGGTPKLVLDDAARSTRDQTAFPLAGWLSFQPLWDEIGGTDPERPG